MRAESGFIPPFRPPLRFDRGPDRNRQPVREGIGRSNPPFRGAVSGSIQRGAGDGRREPVPARLARSRYGLLVEDMKGLLGRTVVYVLALLGMLHLLGLAVAA